LLVFLVILCALSLAVFGAFVSLAALGLSALIVLLMLCDVRTVLTQGGRTHVRPTLMRGRVGTWPPRSARPGPKRTQRLHRKGRHPMPAPPVGLVVTRPTPSATMGRLSVAGVPPGLAPEHVWE